MKNITCLHCQYKSEAAKKLTPEELKRLETGHAEVTFRAGEMIFKQNALSTNVTYIKSGLVKIHVNRQEKEKIVRIVKSPAYLCLPSNFSEKVNHFSATALEETTVCFLDLDAFKGFIYHNGDFAYQIILDLSKNEIRNFNSCLNNAQKQTTGRIADCILFFSREIYSASRFTLPISRQDLGDMAGTSRESASRIIRNFHDEKIIRLEGKKILILNEKLLQQISDKG